MSEEENQETTLERMAVSVFRAGSNVPVAAQTVIALRSFGLSPTQIAQRLGYKDVSGVRKLLYRYDPNRIAERGDAVRRLVLSGMFERVIFEVLSSLKPADLSEMPIKDRMDVAVKATKAMTALKASPIELTKNEKDLLDELKGEIDVEAIEIKETE